MSKKYIFFYIAIAMASLNFSVSKANAWGLTIEDLMERQGISRTDRVIDIRKLVLDALNLEVVLPWENSSPDLEDIIGSGAFNDISDAYTKAKDTYKTIERSYKNVENAYNTTEGTLSSVVNGLERLDTITGTYSAEIQNIGNIDFSQYAKEDPETGTQTIDLYEEAIESAEKNWQGEGRQIMREIGIAHQPFGSAKAALGASRVENSHETAYSDKAVADFATKAGNMMVQNIIKDMAEAQVLANKIKIQGRELNESYMKAYSDNQSTYVAPGGSWRATAAGYTTLNKMKLGKDSMTGNLYKMMKLRFRIKSYAALMKTYDYAEFCRTALNVNADKAASIY